MRWRCKFPTQQPVCICLCVITCLGGFAYMTVWFLGDDSGEAVKSADKYYEAGSSLEERLRDFPHSYPTYQYLLNTDKCADDVTLLIGVCSAVQHIQRRTAIRNTWGVWVHNITVKVKVIFLFGRSRNETLQKSLKEESERFGDIIQQDFSDTYYNLTLKSLMLLHWTLEACGGVKYVMKTDDDVFVHVPNLAAYAHVVSKPVHLFGHVIHGAVPDGERNRRYYRGDFPIVDMYPDYLSGTGYVMSAGAARALYTTALQETLFFVEDVFITGVCAARAGVRREHHRGFHYEKRTNHPCSFQNIVTAHHMTPPEMTHMWQQLHHTNYTCFQQHLINNSLTLLILIAVVLLLLVLMILVQKC